MTLPKIDPPKVDPIDLAIFQSAVHSIAEEMGAALRRTALSPNIKERRDYSCAIFDADDKDGLSSVGVSQAEALIADPAIWAQESAELAKQYAYAPPISAGKNPVLLTRDYETSVKNVARARAALAAGRLDDAAEFLGYPWFVSGTVIHGDKRGRELGFPTANLRLDPACALRHGIYAVRTAIAGQRYDGVASFGRRPMFDSGAVLLEIFLFDFAGDLYAANIDVAFIAWLRDEAMFASANDLMRQMKEDSRLAREALARAGAAFPPI